MESSEAVPETSSLLIAEDHVLVRDTIISWLSQHEEFRVVSTADSISGISESLQSQRIDIVVLDLALGDEDALHQISQWKKSHPNVRFLILSASRNYSIAKRALENGALAFVSKSDPAEDFIKGLRSVRANRSYLSASLSPFLSGEKSDLAPSLTRREEDILREVASGRTSREIASRLGISNRTVERHRDNIKSKLKLTSRAELIRHAIRLFSCES